MASVGILTAPRPWGAGFLTRQIKAPRPNVPANKTQADLSRPSHTEHHFRHDDKPAQIQGWAHRPLPLTCPCKERQRIESRVLRAPCMWHFFSHFHAFAHTSCQVTFSPRHCPPNYLLFILCGSVTRYIFKKYRQLPLDWARGHFALLVFTHPNCLILLYHSSPKCGHPKEHRPCMLL